MNRIVKRILFVAMLVFTAFSANVFSQLNENSRVFSLREVLNITMQNNYDLRISNASIDYSESDLKQAFGRYLPSLSYNANYSRQLNPNESTNPIKNYDYYNMRLGANIMLFDGFAREANYTRAQKSLQSSRLNLEQMLQNIYIDAYNEYINVVRTMQILRVRRENIELGRAELERTRAKFEAGVLPINAVYAQEADLGTKEIELIQAENELNIAKARLLTIMGMNPDLSVEFDINSIPSELNDLVLQDFKQEIGSFPNAVQTALENRLDFQSAKLRHEAAEQSLEMARAAYFPTLSASTDWQWNNVNFSGFDKGNFYFGLNLNVPIFSNFSIDAQVQTITFQLEQNNVELLKLEQSIRAGVQIAYLNLTAAEKQVLISQKTVFSAEQNYLSTKERVDVGAATINDLILANTQLITAQINQIAAVYNYVRSQNEIKFAMGRMMN